MTYIRRVGHVLHVVDADCVESIVFLEDRHHTGPAAECKLIYLGELGRKLALLEVVVLQRGIGVE